MCLRKSASAARQYLKPFETVLCFSTNPLSVEKGEKCIVQDYESMVDWKAAQFRSSSQSTRMWQGRCSLSLTGHILGHLRYIATYSWVCIPLRNKLVYLGPSQSLLILCSLSIDVEELVACSDFHMNDFHLHLWAYGILSPVIIS